MEFYRQPEIQENFYATLNQMGYMLVKPEIIIQSFIDFAPSVKAPVLDIGCAYGIATLPALEKGAYVIANDLDENHLKILYSKAPPHLRNQLELKQGKMPKDLKFADESLGAILASRVLNFISPDELKLCFSLIYKWLKPGGKFFYLGGTPFMGTFSKFLPIYQERKRENLRWPGFIEDLPSYSSPSRIKHLPSFINLLDEDNVRQLMIEAGFKIEYMDFIPAEEKHPEDMKYDGREHLGAIGVK